MSLERRSAPTQHNRGTGEKLTMTRDTWGTGWKPARGLVWDLRGTVSASGFTYFDALSEVQGTIR